MPKRDITKLHEVKATRPELAGIPGDRLTA
jgi:hypothetical protein